MSFVRHWIPWKDTFLKVIYQGLNTALDLSAGRQRELLSRSKSVRAVMKLVVSPGKALVGEVSLPGDKSISHRAALFASMAEGESICPEFSSSWCHRCDAPGSYTAWE